MVKSHKKSKRILTENGMVSGYITIEDGYIRDISVLRRGLPGCGELGIYPGIIDIHNHGFGGWSMTSPCEDEDVRGYAKALASVGVTGILPTAKEDAFEAVAG